MDRLDAPALQAIATAYQRGMGAFAVPEPVTHADWARRHFYLSSESSYIESRWVPWPYQTGLMNLMACDDIEVFSLRKSQRYGYTKMLVSFIAYTAHHKRRNQAIWQPTDDDAKEFVKTEIDTMLRDVHAMQDVMPSLNRRDKDNTLDLKKFIGSTLYVRGAKAEKNFRRISVHHALLDEVDGMDRDIEKAGTPVRLAWGRTIGAPYPKLGAGTTPKTQGFSHIEDLEREADILLRYCMPCPHCGGMHPLSFGGRDEPHGFKWTNRDPATVRHLCPHCGALTTKADYNAAAEAGRCRWQAQDGRWMDDQARFFDADGTPIPHPRRVAAHGWAAYNPHITWDSIVQEFIEAIADAEIGKKEKLKTFRNNTLGETYAEDITSTDVDELRARAEPYKLGTVPRGGLILLAGCDTQDNRIEINVWAMGRGGEMWPIDDRVIWGNPGEEETWDEVAAYLFESEFPNSFGQRLRIEASAIDSGGHFTSHVYEFARKHARRAVFAVRGYSGREKAIKQGANKVDYDYRGRPRKHGVIVWTVGTNLAKDLLYARQQVARPGPGYLHLCDELTDEWYAQFAGEARTTRRTAIGDESRWSPTRRRVEKWDCATYVVWLEHQLELHRKGEKWWADRENRLQPMVADMFSTAAQTRAAQPAGADAAPNKLSLIHI